MALPDLLPTIIFYLFALATLLSGVMVVSAKNPVHSVLFLILAFFSAAGLFILLGAEFLAMILVIVYVGAVAVLFLFVVMMLDIDIAQLREGFLRYLPVGLTVAAVIFAELFVALRWSLSRTLVYAAARQPIPANVSNTKAIGDVLYTWYLYPFQLSGIILFIAMIGAIVLTLRTRPDTRRQSIRRQIARNKKSGIEIVKVQSGEGIS